MLPIIDAVRVVNWAAAAVVEFLRNANRPCSVEAAHYALQVGTDR